jgi:hypothetical protein
VDRVENSQLERARISAGNSGEQEARNFPLRNGGMQHLEKFA